MLYTARCTVARVNSRNSKSCLYSNNSPKGVDYVIPGNDDAARAISLYCDLVSRAALDGMSAQMGAAGIDIGAMEEAPAEETLDETAGA